MSKILCERMKGRQLNTAFGQFAFDQQGIAEVPDEHVNKLLALNGYKLVGGKSAEPEKEDASDAQNGAENGQVDKTSNEGEDDQKNDESDAEQSEEGAGQEDEDQTEDSDDGEDAEQENEEEPEKGGKSAVTVEYLNGKNVAQLKKIAKDNNIDLAGAAKKDEIIPIILGAMNQ